MTLCRSTTNRQLPQWQSLQRQWRLCPLRHDTTPWLRQRAHLGVRSNLLDDDDLLERASAVDARLLLTAGSSWSGSSSEKPSMSRYSSDVSLSDTVSTVRVVCADIVHYCTVIGQAYIYVCWNRASSARRLSNPTVTVKLAQNHLLTETFSLFESRIRFTKSVNFNLDVTSRSLPLSCQ